MQQQIRGNDARGRTIRRTDGGGGGGRNSSAVAARSLARQTRKARFSSVCSAPAPSFPPSFLPSVPPLRLPEVPVGGIGTYCMQCEEGDYFQRFAVAAAALDFLGGLFVSLTYPYTGVKVAPVMYGSRVFGTELRKRSTSMYLLVHKFGTFHEYLFQLLSV